MKKLTKILALVLTLVIMMGVCSVSAFAEDTGAFNTTGDYYQAPYDGTYRAKDGSTIVVNKDTLTWNGNSYESFTEGENIGTEFAGNSDFKTADGIYGSALVLGVETSDGYSFRPFLSESGQGIIVVKQSDYIKCDYDGYDHKDYVVSSAVAYTKEGTTAKAATVSTPASTAAKIDTGAKLTVKSGKTYQFKITASSKPTFTCGNSSIFKIVANGFKGKDYYFKVTAVGKHGQATGFYLNGEKSPRTIGTIG